MYARLLLFTLGPGNRSTAEKLVEQFAPVLKARKGFQSATFFGDDTTGEYGTFVLWASKEDAEAAREAVFPQLEKALSGMLKAAPIPHPLYEVMVEVKA
ncbi:MAG: hypothetical protein V3T73_01370 [Dehalococcoidales bacterium]